MTTLPRPVGEAVRALPPHRIRQAVILVGGKGSRLGELTRADSKTTHEDQRGSGFSRFADR